ncbi:MAG: glycosyltransferase family 39 protein [Candidatus Micrarchaeaceae archaeon]
MVRKTLFGISEWRKGVRIDIRWYALLAGIMIFGLFLSFLLYAGPNPFGDDATYIWLSTQPLIGPPFILSNIFAYGFLRLLILKASFIAMGYWSLPAILPNIVEYLILIFMTFLIGRRFGGQKTGIVAAFLAATAPFAVSNVTTVLPDIGTGMMLSISIYIFMRSMEDEHNVLLSFLFGLVAVLVLYMNEEGFATLLLSWLYVIFMLMANLLSGKVSRKRRAISMQRRSPAEPDPRYVLFALLGTAIGLFIYFLVFYMALGAPFYVFSHRTFGYASISQLDEIRILFFSNFLAGNQLNNLLYPLGPISILAIAGTVILLARGNRRDNFLSFLTWGFVVIIVFGTTVFSGRYESFPVSTRFFNIVLAPIAVLGAYALTSAYGFLKRLIGTDDEPAMLLIALLFIVILSSIPLYTMLQASNSQIHDNAQTIYSIAAFIQKHVPNGTNATIYTHAYIGFNFVLPLFLEFAMGFSSNVHLYSINSSFINSSQSCNLLRKNGPSFLVVADDYAPAVVSQVNSEVESWLSTNCTATLLMQANQIYLYSLKSST